MENKEKLIKKYLELKKSIDSLKTEQDFVKSQLGIVFEVEGITSAECEEGYATIQNRKTESVIKSKVKEILGDRFSEVVSLKESSFIVVKAK